MTFRFWRAVARAVRALSRRIGRSGGTTLPGRLLLRVSPDALERMGGELDDGAAVVSATNGKTTSAAMTAAILERSGERIVHNRAGSNMGWGVATALLDAGRERGQLGLFEVDEAWLPRVAEALHPGTYLLSNLFRDQLDRYGELELLADAWAELIAAEATGARLVLNADDPLIADLGREREGVTYFGLGDDSQALPALQHAADSKHCRNCGHPYEYEAVYLGHLGRYRCPNCGRERPAPAVSARSVELEGMTAARFELVAAQGSAPVRLPLPGLYNVYNAVGAAALALELGAGLDDTVAALEGFGGAFGRVETIPVPVPGGTRPVSILLVKNPAGRERGPAHSDPRRRADRPLDRPERQDRRRARHLMGLGRRLRGAGRPRRPRDLLRHPGRGDGPAPEVRRRRRGPGGRPRPRPLAGCRGSGRRARPAALRPTHLHGAARGPRRPRAPRTRRAVGGLTEYVFAYGSLVADLAGSPARLRGYRRVLGVAADNSERIPGYKVYTDAADGSVPPVFVAFADLRPDEDTIVNGVVAPVSAAQLDALDARERNYDRVDVTLDVDPDPGTVWAYVGSDAGRERLAAGVAAGRAVVSRTYLQTLDSAFRALGEEEYEEFLESSELTGLPVADLNRLDVP